MAALDSHRLIRPGRFGLAGLLLLAAACGKPGADAGNAAPFAAAIDSAALDALTKREMPGMAITVVQGDRIVYSRGFGKADLATGRPYTDTTHTVIGSTSKPVTALAALRLVQLGRIALDTPIVRYVPDLVWADPRASAITMRHLLTNRSGMVAGFSGPAYQRPSEVDDGAVERLARNIAAMPLLFAPGEGYAYSNRGWSMAGYLIQRVTGTPIEQFLRKEVFEPLGMTETTLEFWKVADLATGYAEGRVTRNHVHPASLSREYGASGMIVSTARDMGRLLVAMLNGGKTVLGTQYLTPELIAEAVRPQAEATSELGGPTRYGLGWEVDSTFGALTIKKAGSVHSMVSFWVILPERKTAVAFAFNREDYKIVPLVPRILTILAGGKAEPMPVEPPVEFTPPKGVRVPAAAIGRWIGSYDSRNGDFRVFQRGDSLLTDYEGSEILLVPTSDSSFALVDDLVNNAGKTLIFRRQGAAVTVWDGADSVGIKRSR